MKEAWLMQNGVKSKKSVGQAWLLLLGMLLVIGLSISTIIKIFAPEASNDVKAFKLPFAYNETLTPFGNNVLYYDGTYLQCVSERGALRWSFHLGSNAGFHANDDTVVAWAGSTLYILNSSGRSTYSDDLLGNIQFARVGEQYIAAIVGEMTSSSLVVKDLSGTHMDEESSAYEDLIILEVGFYGENGEHMWSLSYDVFGTTANTILNTYEVGRMNTGEYPLGEAITYSVIYEKGKLRVINTETMMTFDERGTLQNGSDVLVYGWQLIDHVSKKDDDAMMLFAPTTQTSSQSEIRELRLVTEENDIRFSLPDKSIGALIHPQYIFAFSENSLYRAGHRNNRFITFDVPIETPITNVIGLLGNDYALVSSNADVYTVSLPQEGENYKGVSASERN